MESQFLAIHPRSGHQQLHDHVVFAVVTAERLEVNVRYRLEGIVNCGANLAASAVEGAVRLRPRVISQIQSSVISDSAPSTSCLFQGARNFFDKIVVVVCHASLLPSVVRIHPPAADEIGHGGSDRIRLLNDHEMPGARDIDDLHPLT